MHLYRESARGGGFYPHYFSNGRTRCHADIDDGGSALGVACGLGCATGIGIVDGGGCPCLTARHSHGHGYIAGYLFARLGGDGEVSIIADDYAGRGIHQQHWRIVIVAQAGNAIAAGVIGGGIIAKESPIFQAKGKATNDVVAGCPILINSVLYAIEINPHLIGHRVA